MNSLRMLGITSGIALLLTQSAFATTPTRTSQIMTKTTPIIIVKPVQIEHDLYSVKSSFETVKTGETLAIGTILSLGGKQHFGLRVTPGSAAQISDDGIDFTVVRKNSVPPSDPGESLSMKIDNSTGTFSPPFTDGFLMTDARTSVTYSIIADLTSAPPPGEYIISLDAAAFTE